MVRGVIARGAGRIYGVVSASGVNYSQRSFGLGAVSRLSRFELERASRLGIAGFCERNARWLGTSIAQLEVEDSKRTEKDAEPSLKDAQAEGGRIASTSNLKTLLLDDLCSAHSKGDLEEMEASGTLLTCQDSLDTRVRSAAVVNPESFKASLGKAVGLFVPSVVQHELTQLRAELKPFEAGLEVVDRSAKRNADFLSVLGLALLTAQTGAFIYLTYVMYGWDIMEPFSYFVGQAILMSAYAYFLFIKRDHSLQEMWQRMWNRRRALLLKRRGIDLAAIERLQREIKKRETLLQHARQST
mmetsp:Transcript_14427/g.31051  ORF Transcript_14427/g.31051 Transcript_14427/m.31051 type:complete len:300 (+) Transcript_14427:46-945(+)